MRVISRKEMDFLLEELSFWQEMGVVDAAAAARIGALYSVRRRGFAQMLLCAGALLLGLGVLCAVAANWSDIPRAARMGLIVGCYAASLFVSWLYQEALPRTSRALLLCAGLVFGGGIFLTAQMFHQDGHWSTAFGWWAAGLLPAVALFRDPWQLVLAQVLAGGYFGGLDLMFWSGGKTLLEWQVLPVLLLSVLWLLWLYSGRGEVPFHMNILLSAFVLFTRLADPLPMCGVLLVFFALGTLMMFAPGGDAAFLLSVWGVAFCGTAGLALTFPEVWQGFSAVAFSAKQLAAGSAAALALLMTIRLYCGSGMAGAFLGLLVLRYFADKLFGFLSKAAGFSTLGALCLVAGLVWERRMRRKKRTARRKKGEKRE